MHGMRRKKEENALILQAGSVLAVALSAAVLTALLLTAHYRHAYFRVLGGICEEILEQQPEAERAVVTALKEYRPLPMRRPLSYLASGADEPLILAYGYKAADFFPSATGCSMVFAGAGWLLGGAAFLFLLYCWRRRERARIMLLSGYLEKINRGEGGIFLTSGGKPDISVCEDTFAKLQDELYKTVTALYQTREAAVAARDNYAENLSNIAHQLKTPVTAISLSLQMLRGCPSSEQPGPLQDQLGRIQHQLDRLTHLEDALLLLSRIDAGTLILEKKTVDIFTLITLAADNLQEMLLNADVSLHIEQTEEVLVCADPDWTMEAVMNLLKNCIEHTPSGGCIYCTYEQNPLYTQIRLQDTGTGFSREDLLHLFERFYQGKNRKNGGIGIGLALSRAIIESQNGTIRACNVSEGGACFEVRFYHQEVCH